MPRRARMYLSDYPFHLVQRGNNRNACFFTVGDYQFYLELLAQLLPKYGVALHAYVLMTNHVHLLLTPHTDDGISRLTRVLGSRYAQYINKKYRRTGTLWEGRHKACLIDTHNYLLKCYRYIELNPVAANMVERPDEYRWSSYGVNALGDRSDIVTPHAEFLHLGKARESRCLMYRSLFGTPLNASDRRAIRQATHYCQPLGSVRFRASIEARLGCSLGRMGRGRPRKQGGAEGG